VVLAASAQPVAACFLVYLTRRRMGRSERLLGGCFYVLLGCAVNIVSNPWLHALCVHALHLLHSVLMLFWPAAAGCVFLQVM
jgi:hypothetical protein